MEPIHKTIDRIINAIDWKKIKDYHKKLGILWEFEEDKETVKRIPTIQELKDDLRSLLFHMHTETLDYISYGSWVVFWENESASIGDIRVIFRLADFHFEENRDSRESMEEALKKALEREDYEYAAMLRDSLKKQKD
jgi:hypothetical protein